MDTGTFSLQRIVESAQLEYLVHFKPAIGIFLTA